MYVWRTSIPKHMLSKKYGRRPLKHISQVNGPRSTLEFLQQTQKYIHGITKQDMSRGKSTSPEERPSLPSIGNPKKSTTGSLSPSVSSKYLIPGRKSTESLLEVGKRSSSRESDYTVTKYVLARPISPRLAITLPRLSDQGASHPSSKHFTNQAIETFLNRFDAKRDTKTSFGVNLNLLR